MTLLSHGPAALADSGDIARVLTEDGVLSVYQPIVELETGLTVGYEALARGPLGSSLHTPDALFAAARHAGRLSELDVLCQAAALEGCRTGGLKAPWALFVNMEPESAQDAFLFLDDREGGLPSAVGGEQSPKILVELTERALIADPLQLLRLVTRIRSRGWGIALDDVGADPDSLALLPLLRPDVIKLDLRLVQGRPTSEIALIVSAVNAEAERSGTVILAEGIETHEHLNIALAMGATLGQGWLLGRPGALPADLPALARTPINIIDRGAPTEEPSPYKMGAALRAPRPARKKLLIEISKHLERQALRAGESTVVVSTFQDASFFTESTRRRYAELVNNAAFVGALGEGMAAEPLPGVRGCILAADDPLLGEWDIVVVGPHFTATLVARDLGDTGPDHERRFEFVMSHDRELAITVALTLMSRVWPRT